MGKPTQESLIEARRALKLDPMTMTPADAKEANDLALIYDGHKRAWREAEQREEQRERERIAAIPKCVYADDYWPSADNGEGSPSCRTIQDKVTGCPTCESKWADAVYESYWRHPD